MNWLTGDDSLISIQPRRPPMSSLSLSKTSLFIIVVTFLIALPALLLGCGALVWWRRRRA